MTRYFIKVENNKITETILRPDDEFCKSLKGYIEITAEDFEKIEPFKTYKYSNGVIELDTDAEAKAEKENELRAEWDALQDRLNSTDYIVIKIAEGVATADDYANTIAERAKWRERINEIQKELE